MDVAAWTSRRAAGWELGQGLCAAIEENSDSIVSQKKTVSSLKAVRGWHEAPHMKGNGFTQSLLLQMSITSTKNTFTTTSRPVSDQTAGHRSPVKRTHKRNHRGDRIQSLGKEKFLGDVGF